MLCRYVRLSRFHCILNVTCCPQSVRLSRFHCILNVTCYPQSVRLSRFHCILNVTCCPQCQVIKIPPISQLIRYIRTWISTGLMSGLGAYMDIYTVLKTRSFFKFTISLQAIREITFYPVVSVLTAYRALLSVFIMSRR